MNLQFFYASEANALTEWACTEKNRVKASKIMRAAENIEKQWLLHRYPNYLYHPLSSSALAKVWRA